MFGILHSPHKSKKIANRLSPAADKYRIPAMTYAELQQRLVSVITSFCGDCEVETEVPATRFDRNAHEKAKPVSVLVSRDGVSRLAIAVVTKNTYKSMPVVGTQRGVQQAGIPYIRFFCELPNEESYIADRVREYLG